MFGIDIKVRYSETDPEGIVSPHQLLDYFQDTGTFHSISLGMLMGGAYNPDQGWFVLAYRVNVFRYPRLGEEIRAYTEPYKMKGFYGYRRFYIKDANDETLVLADSIWVLMDLTNLLPVRIPEEMRAAFMADHEEEKPAIKRKLPEKGNWEEIETIEVTSIFVDQNHHVNNTFYMQWAESLIPRDLKVDSFQLDFRQSGRRGDTIHVFSEVKDQTRRIKYVNQDDLLIALVELSCSPKKPAEEA